MPSHPRPRVVTVAYRLQCALAATCLGLSAVTIARVLHYESLIAQAVRATGAGGLIVSLERRVNLFNLLIVALPLLVLAVWLGLAAARTCRGSRVARILTWVGLGLPLLVAGIAPVAFVVGFTATDTQSFFSFGSEGFLYELDRRDDSAWFIAYDVGGTILTVAAMLLAVAVGVLLATGPANRWFTRR